MPLRFKSQIELSGAVAKRQAGDEEVSSVETMNRESLFRGDQYVGNLVWQRQGKLSGVLRSHR
jgi:hypothetical protein